MAFNVSMTNSASVVDTGVTESVEPCRECSKAERRSSIAWSLMGAHLWRNAVTISTRKLTVESSGDEVGGKGDDRETII